MYNRGIYPEERFVKVRKYGPPMLLTQDEGVKSFLAGLTSQSTVAGGQKASKSGRPLERWNFCIETDPEVVEKGVIEEKSDKQIMREIQAIMCQIASSITYLLCLDEPCVFDVLTYTDMDVAVPFTWIESDQEPTDGEATLL